MTKSYKILYKSNGIQQCALVELFKYIDDTAGIANIVGDQLSAFHLKLGNHNNISEAYVEVDWLAAVVNISRSQNKLKFRKKNTALQKGKRWSTLSSIQYDALSTDRVNSSSDCLESVKTHTMPSNRTLSDSS